MSKVLSFLFCCCFFLQALWIITLLFVISTNDNVHASLHAMVSLYKVHMVRSHSHVQKHLILHTQQQQQQKRTQWQGQGKANVLMVLTNDNMARWGRAFTAKICKPPHKSSPSKPPTRSASLEASSATRRQRGTKRVGRGRSGVTVMLSPAALLSEDY